MTLDAPGFRPAKRVTRLARLATPAGLVLLAAGASAYAYLVDRGAISDGDRVERPRDVFPSFRIDEVRRVKLTQGSDILVLERARAAGSAWTLASPQRPETEAADPAAVDVLLRELQQARRVREMPDSIGAAQSAPRVRGEVTVGPLEYTFSLGDDAPVPEGSAYMSLEGEGVFVVGSTLKVQLLRTADAYRERALAPYGASDVAMLSVHSAQGTFSIERAGATFHLGGAAGLRASRAAVDRIFAALAEARADSFVDDAEADRLTASPTVTVVVTARLPERPLVRFVTGAACPGHPSGVVAVRTEPSRMSACIPQEAADELGARAEALADDLAFFAHADEIEEVKLESPSADGPRVEIARRGTGWRERSPEARDLDPEEVESANGLVGMLASARSADVRRARGGERLPVHARATIVRTGTGVNEVLEIGPPDADGIALTHRLEDDAVLRLPRDVARHFDPHPVALRGRAVWSAAFDPASVVAIDDSCGALHERIDLAAGRWTMRAPAGVAADSLTVVDLTEAFAHATADAWVAESDDGTFGLGRRVGCAITLTLAKTSSESASPTREVGVTFGAEGDGGYYARTSDAPGIFVAPAALHDLASHPAIDRSRFRLDPTALARVVLVGPSAKVTLKNAGGRLVASSGTRIDGGSGGGNATGSADIERALASFYARDAIHAGPAVRSEGFDRPVLDIDAIAGVGAGPFTETRIVIGALGHDGAVETYFARVSGTDATFAVPREDVDPLLPLVAAGAP